MPITYHKKKEEKMAKTRNRIKNMNFQIQERKVEELSPLSDDDKYIIEMSGYGKNENHTQNKDIHRTIGRSTRPQYI